MIGHVDQSDRRMPILAGILSRVAEEMGAHLLLDPQWYYAGQITFASGKRIYFRGSSLDVNPHGASEIAKDKDFAAFFMRSMGFPAVIGETFFSREWAETIGSNRTADAALTYASGVGFPLVVKPNSASQGRGVQFVMDQCQLSDALAGCFELDRVALLQPLVKGRDFRVVVLGNEVISAYERVPLSVLGDGRKNIGELLAAKLRVIARQNRFASNVRNDVRIDRRLKNLGLAFSSVLPMGEELRLLDSANLSSGGQAIDITEDIAPAVAQLCIELTREMGLHLSGVDVIIDGDARHDVDDLTIIEINSSPGLDNYASLGEVQAGRVLNLYRKVLEHLEESAF